MPRTARTRVGVLAFVALSVPALAAPDWNGTWVGNWQAHDGVQIIMAGNDATGLFWHGDYVPDDLNSSVSADGKTLTITWDDSRAVVIRDGAATAHVTIHEPGHPDAAFALTLDH